MGQSLGNWFFVEGGEEYSNLGELIVNHVRAVARRAEELMAHEKFKVGPEDKLRKSHPTPQLMQKTFKEQDTRFQNQGEVSILRKKMEKVRTEFCYNHSSCCKGTIRTHIPVV